MLETEVRVFLGKQLVLELLHCSIFKFDFEKGACQEDLTFQIVAPSQGL